MAENPRPRGLLGVHLSCRAVIPAMLEGHAEHDDVDDLLARIGDIRERDMNAIRLQR